MRCGNDFPDVLATTNPLGSACGPQVAGRADAEKSQRVVPALAAIEYSLPEFQALDGASHSGKVHAHERHAPVATLALTASRLMLGKRCDKRINQT